MFDREKNFRSRLEFVRFWAAYVKSHPNEEWSRQQAAFINSVMRTANQDVELYKKVKGLHSR
ncbi:MAG: hypothetical protein HYY37_04405 [Candidatus Aenigmarchaeota archaeon]|nr:hypothetical protein [Candidatus Aenigmarchaeota archaeon]